LRMHGDAHDSSVGVGGVDPFVVGGELDGHGEAPGVGVRGKG
jgi:hypothetical protein